MKKLTAFVLSAMMVLSLAACGAKTETPADTSTPAADATKPAEVAKLTYAVEAGSAGEEVALANGYNVVSVDSQAKALMEVQAGTADAAIIDSLMAGAMVGEGTSYPNLTITDQKLTEELYGVGCRKGSDLASFINSVMADAYADGVLEATAETYGVQAALVEQPASEFTASESDSDVQYIKDKGTLVIGITEFEPMDYQDADGNWIGFDADMAKLVAEKLGVEPVFTVINWDNKVFELNSKNIDVVWNGMTLTDDVKALMATSEPYCLNGQVVVLAADVADQYQTVESLSGLSFAVENGSAGMEQAEAAGLDYVAMDTQAKALMEVASGTSDAAIIDLLMAGAMIGEGTSYPDMKLGDELTTEEYGVGCRKGSDLADFINSVFAETYADGTMLEIAKTYGVQESLVEQPAVEEVSYADDGDVAYIKDKGPLIVGITDFEPMDYKDENGEWIGFDADMAKLVAEKLGVEIQFIEIDWDNKILELEAKSIDVVWNGMTLTSEVMNAMQCTNAYCNNAQVVVTNG